MLPTDKIIHCKIWELNEVKKLLRRDGYKIMVIDHVTDKKVVVVARERLIKR